MNTKGKELVIVLDNCDKRSLEEQLLMFEVANWVKDNIKAIVFLPLRDTTFDHYRNEKPLDTVVKDLIFRINPPPLEKVIYNRIKYASRLSEKLKDKYYYLPNGFKVTYPSSEELYYLKSILTSLFQNQFFRRLIAGLSGSDIRRGIEIFLDFCKSGHISDKEIFKMRQSKGEFVLPDHIIARVFLRGNRLYYSDAEVRVKNVFYSDPSDDLPDPFIRVAMLKWLKDKYSVKGPSGIKGYHKMQNLIEDLVKLGHATSRLEQELINMLRHSLIISESQNSNTIENDELISINPPGLIHLDLIDNIDYLSSCAEDIWFSNETTAMEVARDLAGEGTYSHLSLQNTMKHADIVVDYLENYFDKFFKIYSEYLSESSFTLPVDFKKVKDGLKNLRSKVKYNQFREFEDGAVVDAQIVNIKEFGILCKLDNTEQVGLIHKSNITDVDFDYNYKIGENIKVRVKEYKPEHNKYELYFYENS